MRAWGMAAHIRESEIQGDEKSLLLPNAAPKGGIINS
jgi:hypothetical protein